MNIEQIKRAQKKAAKDSGRAWWFEQGAMDFFDSVIESDTFHNPGVGPKHYFVSSEQCHFSDGTSAPRKYSVRIWDETVPDQVETWGKFQQFKTKDAAIRVATRLGVYGKLPVSEVGEDGLEDE
jgi:hypothetical protein